MSLSFSIAASLLVVPKALLLARFSSHFAHSPRVISSHAQHPPPAMLRDSQLSMPMQIKLSIPTGPVWSSGVVLSFSSLVVLYLMVYNQLGRRSWGWIVSFSLFSPKEWMELKSSFSLVGETLPETVFQERHVWPSPGGVGGENSVHGGGLCRMCSSLQALSWRFPREPPNGHMTPLLSSPSHSHTFSLFSHSFLCLLPFPTCDFLHIGEHLTFLNGLEVEGLSSCFYCRFLGLNLLGNRNPSRK